ncbi:MAG TPA: DUF2961 domain-containing protein, partial [Armatimonadota bacterium]|nr:DUF2961 domain-containing protein [Armatimonadota bacterium]
YTGYQPYYNGAAAYRFNVNDCISFKKSLKMTVGFGKQETGFRTDFSKPENPLEFSSVAYWYQQEPHATWTPMGDARHRRPTFFQQPSAHDTNETVVLNCGQARKEIEYLADGWDFAFKRGYSYQGWPSQVNHCWADFDSLEFDIVCPKESSGILKLYIIDGDNLAGGREESISVAGKLIGSYKGFQSGQWIEIPISGADTASGRISVVIKNLKPGGNAVVSLVRFEGS